MRFMAMYTPSKDRAGAPPSKEHMAEMTKFVDEATKSGELLATGGLLPISKGARVVYSGGKLSVTDGPFTESKELIAGFWLIQVKSKEEAIEWASRSPAPHGPDQESEIEIRQVFEAADFPAEIFPPEDAAREQELRDELQRRAGKP